MLPISAASLAACAGIVATTVAGGCTVISLVAGSPDIVPGFGLGWSLGPSVAGSGPGCESLGLIVRCVAARAANDAPTKNIFNPQVYEHVQIIPFFVICNERFRISKSKIVYNR